MKQAWFFFLVILTTSSYGYNYRQLITKDYEDMQGILRSYVKKSQAQAKLDDGDYLGAKKELQKGLEVLFMRPNPDNLQQSLITILQNEAIKYEPFLNFLERITKNSLQTLKNDKVNSGKKGSHFLILENITEYLAHNKQKFSEDILGQIAKARVKTPKSIQAYRALEGGKVVKLPPSTSARKILKERKKARKKLEEKKKKKSGKKQKSS